MRVSKEVIDGHYKVTLAEYDSPRDLIREAKQGRNLSGDLNPDKWAGGSIDFFESGLKGEVISFAGKAKKWVDRFSNVAIEKYERTLDANMTYGSLDYAAAMAGDPMCMYGPTIEKTDRSVVDIYIDPWVSGNVKPEAIEKRGIAILALVQALQVYRPVNTYIVKGSQYNPKRADTIQTLAIPTMPMDLARASFMLCSPTLNRHGFLYSIYAVHNAKKHCASPPMSASRWQATQLGGWLAERHGVQDYIYLPRMEGKRGFWSTETDTVAWVKAQLDKFIG